MITRLEKLIQFIFNYAKTSSVIIVFGIFALVPLIGGINFTTSYKAFVGLDSPSLIPLITIEDEFGKFNNAFLMLEPSNGDVFDPEFITALIDITERSWALPYVKRIDSLSNFQYTIVEQDELIVGDFISTQAITNKKELAHLKGIATTHTEMLNYYINPSATATGLNIDFEIDETDIAKIMESWKALKLMLVDFQEQYQSNNINISIAGVQGVNNGFIESIEIDIKLVLPLAFALIFIGISILFKNIYCGLITLLVSALSSIAALALAGVFQWTMLPFTTSGVIIIMILSVADTTHIMSAVSRNIQNGMQKKEAIAKGITQNIRGLTLTTLTTTIAFLSFCYSEFVAIIAMGGYVAFGIVFALILSLTLLPALLTFINFGQSKPIINPKVFTWAALTTIKYRTWLLVLTIPTIIVGGYLSLQNELNDSLAKNMNDDAPYNQAIKRIDERLTGSSYLLYNISSRSGKTVSDPTFARQVESFANWYRQQSETRFVRSYTDILKRLNKDLHRSDEQFYKLPENQTLAAQYLLLYEMSLPLGQDLTTQINLDKTSTLMQVNVRDLSIHEVKNIHLRSKNWLSTNAPDLDTETSGSNYAYSEMIYKNFFEMLKSAIMSLVAICILLIIFFRSFYAGIMCAVGVLTPIGLCFGAWAITNGVIGAAASYVISMTVGIAVDNSVHFMSKYLSARENNESKENAIRYAMEQVGEAITINTIVLGFCFATLMFSVFTLYTVMGLMTTITLVLALLATFLLIPSLLTLNLPYIQQTPEVTK